MKESQLRLAEMIYAMKCANMESPTAMKCILARDQSVAMAYSFYKDIDFSYGGKVVFEQSRHVAKYKDQLNAIEGVLGEEIDKELQICVLKSIKSSIEMENENINSMLTGRGQHA